eukprot:scaffold111324_cov44-Prasinocladus_malaysianus.AAC.1
MTRRTSALRSHPASIAQSTKHHIICQCPSFIGRWSSMKQGCTSGLVHGHSGRLPLPRRIM